MKQYSIIITGAIGAGKSTLCWEIYKYLKGFTDSLGGVITLQNEKKWFYLIDENKKISFEAIESEEFLVIGNYKVSKNNLQIANQSIRASLGKDFLFIDEIGFLELQFQGYYEILDLVMKRSQSNIFVVKERILKELIRKYPMLEDYEIVKVFNHNIGIPLESIKKCFNLENSS
ncbi:nucleoside-triphosphatase [Candidatus Hodarchaeum mangrovi]